MKYIVITGGVVSGLGKGITISSVGRILKSSGVKVTSIKIDPYLNVDAGTMSPFEHGETFVLDDGGETDLDLGNYERFLDITLTARHNITTGKIYTEVISQERRGDYLGKTVQIVPHATDMVQNWIKEVSRVTVDDTGLTPDVCLIEVGGTVGDIESMVFLEALRQFQFLVGRENIMFMHVSLVPVLGSVGEQKTKPTQHSVKELRGLGLSPDIIVFHDVSNIYHVPLLLEKQGVHRIIKERLGLDMMADSPDLAKWSEIAQVVDSATEAVDIAIVGKYTGLEDAYLSVTKSLTHSGMLLRVKVKVHWVEASDLEEDTRAEDPDKHGRAWDVLEKAAGVVVPGGFGVRGVEGKVLAAKYCRENKKPFLGVCLGMQVMVIEYARHVMGCRGANSTEFDEATAHPVIVFMPEINQKVMGGTMRLGARGTTISPTLPDGAVSLACEVYGFQAQSETEAAGLPEGSSGSASMPAHLVVMERHRHRYEVNPERVGAVEGGGLIFSGRDDHGVRMEIAELPRSQHPFYLGTQFHPEFKSRPNRPSPPFFGLVASAAGRKAELGRAGLMWRQHEAEAKVAAARIAVAAASTPLSPLGKRDRTLSEMGSPYQELSRKYSDLEAAAAAGGTPKATPKKKA